jgi:tRNA-specific adenosine deaminase 1
MAPIVGKDQDWRGGYKFKPFKVVGTEKEFRYSRRQYLGKGEKLVTSNISAAWTSRWSETSIGGTIQGKRQFDARGASRVCKRRTWKLALEIARAVGVPAIERALSVATYGEVKMRLLLRERRRVKEAVREDALKGWVRNEGEDFGAEGVEV